MVYVCIHKSKDCSIFTLHAIRATTSSCIRSGKNWYNLSNALLAVKSYVDVDTEIMSTC